MKKIAGCLTDDKTAVHKAADRFRKTTRTRGRHQMISRTKRSAE